MQSLRNTRSWATAAALLVGVAINTAIHLPPAHALDAGRSPGEYVVRTWSVGDGLPQNSVTAAAQTRDGYIWLGTHSGLVRFDGVTFRVFSSLNTAALGSDRITALYEDAEGTLWVGTSGGGLASLRGGEWRGIAAGESLSSGFVTSLLGDRGGALWIGTEAGLNRLRGGEITSFNTWHGLAGNSITSLAEDAGGRLLVGTLDGGASVLENVDSDRFKPLADMPARAVNALAVDGDGRIWAGALKGLYVLDGGKVLHYSRRDGLSSNSVSALLSGGNGDIYVGLDAGGLDILRDGEFVSLTGQDRFPDDPVHVLLQDRDGAIWAGTDTRGLVQIKDALVDVIGREDGLLDDEALAVLEGRGGDLWVGTEAGGLCQVRDGRVVRTLDITTGLPRDRIRCLLEDRAGTLWIGTAGGLSRLRNDRITTLTTGDGLSSDDVTALLEDRAGTLWIGTARGLNRLRDGRIGAYERATLPGDAYVRTLFESDRGPLYVGTREGIIRFRDDTPIPLAIKEEGAEPDILSMLEDSSGVLWLGTAGNGLLRYDGDRMVVYTTGDGLPDNHIFSISEDGGGNLWLSSYVGVCRIPRDQLDALLAGTISELTPSLYDEAEGFRNRRCTFEGEPSVCKGRGGRFYYPTIEGVCVLDVESLGRAVSAPRAMIEDMAVDNAPVPEREPGFKDGPHVVQFRFTALDFLAPGKVRFRYMLEGFDEDWNCVEPNGARTAYYFNLTPGDYVFRVKASGNGGPWEETGDSRAFSIVKPLYRRPHVYVAILAAMAAGITGLAARRRRTRVRPEKYSTSAIPDEKVEEVLPKLKRLMEEEKVFLDAELSLQQLAKRAGIHYNYLSRIINEKFGLSYNDYVNGYRIREAQRLLADPGQAERTILDIAYDTGFYSKSVFNTAFKKFTGMTPSRYRRQNANGKP